MEYFLSIFPGNLGKSPILRIREGIRVKKRQLYCLICLMDISCILDELTADGNPVTPDELMLNRLVNHPVSSRIKPISVVAMLLGGSSHLYSK